MSRNRYMPGSIGRLTVRRKPIELFGLVVLAISALGTTPVGAQQSLEEREVPVLYEIAEINFSIVGWTRSESVLAFLGLNEGDRFMSREALEETLERYERDLYNQRVFDEVRVDYEILDESETGPTDTVRPVTRVALHIEIDDGWTLLPVAFYRYNSNTGHNPFVVLYWDNFFGTLTDFGFSAGYYSRNWVDAFGWDIRLDLGGIRMFDRSWSFGFDQEYTTVEKADPRGDLLLRYTYYTSNFGVSTRLRLNENWSYKVSPGVEATYGYETEKNLRNDPIPADTVSPSFSHGVGTGRQDWYRNFRDGWNLGLSNSVAYSISEEKIKSDVSVSSEYFKIFGPVNPSIRGKLQHYFDGDALSKGGDVRGVANRKIFGTTFLKVNTNFAIRVIDIPAFAEFNVSPFLDSAVAVQEDDSLGSDNLFFGAGIDLTMFPHFLRGFQGRASFGVDLRDPPQNILDFGSYEFSITETLEF